MDLSVDLIPPTSGLELYNNTNFSETAKITMEELVLAAATPLRHPIWTVVLLVAAYMAVLIVGLVGNIFVVAIVLKTPKMRTVTNYFILNLAIADLLVLTVCLPPTLVSNIYVPWVMGWLLCKAVPYIQGIAVCASVYSLVAISADRFLAIWFPLRRQITKKVARRIIVLVWMWAAGLALPWLLYFDLSNADQNEPSHVFCVESWPEGMNGNVYFVVVNLVLFYLFPLTLISFCYFSIWLRVWHRHVPKDSSISHVELIHQRAKASVLKMVIVVVAVFAASWLPLYAICLRIKLVPGKLTEFEEQVLDLAYPMAQWLGASNSCINPILYAFFNGKFRTAFCRLLRGRKAWNAQTSIYYNSHYHQYRSAQVAVEKKRTVKLSTGIQNQKIQKKNSNAYSTEYDTVMLRQMRFHANTLAGCNNATRQF